MVRSIWKFHNREYLVAIRPLDDLLGLHTMRFADELVSPDARRAYRLLTDVMSRTDRAALGQFVMRAKDYLALVRARDGAPTPPPDLMDALERTLQEMTGKGASKKGQQKAKA